MAEGTTASSFRKNCSFNPKEEEQASTAMCLHLLGTDDQRGMMLEESTAPPGSSDATQISTEKV